MQNLTAEKAFYDKLFEEKPENEHITEGYEDLYDLSFTEKPSGPVLDLGCGTGAHAVRLGKRGYDVIAIDLTYPGVRSARERFRKEGLEGRFLVADAENLPLRDGVADVTWTSLLLHHFPKLDKLPGELHRITRNKVIAFEPNAQNFLSWFAFNVINPIFGLSTTTKNQRSLWPNRLARTFRVAGFSVQDLHYVHRTWKDGVGLMGFVRSIWEAFSKLLPMRLRANKFLVVFQKTPA